MKDNKKRKKTIHLAAVAVIFNNKGQVLLSERWDPKSIHSHLKWQFPGGGINFGEHPKEAALREVKEEVGLEIDLLSKDPAIFSHVWKEANIHVILFSFTGLYKGGEIDVSKDPETKQAKWFEYDTINFENCLPNTKEMIIEARKIFKQ